MTNNRLFTSSRSIIVFLMLFFTTLGNAQNVPTLVKDIATGTASSQLRSPVVLNTKAYFVANNGSDKLYQTDGTTNGTSQVSGYTDDVTSNIVAWNGQIYFTTKSADATQGTRILLYKTNGSTATFVDTLVSNSSPSSTIGYTITRLFVENNQLLLNLRTAFYLGSSTTLSSHNGQRNGSKLITTVNSDSRSGGATSYLQSTVFVGTNTFYVYGEGGSFGNNSIGKTLSVVRNTTPVSERIIFQRGWFSSNPPPADFQFTAIGVIGDFLYAANKDTLFRYDSTGLRTLIKTGVGPFVGFRSIKVGNLLYIKDGNNKLWRTDGTAAGTISMTETGLQPNEILGDLFTNGTDLYVKTIIQGVFPGLRRVVGNDLASGYGGTGTEAGNSDPIFANGKVYFTTSPNSPCTIGLVEYNPTTNTSNYFPLVTQANCNQGTGNDRVVLPNNVLLLDFFTPTTGFELFKVDLNPPSVSLPDFTCKISNLSVDPSPTGYPRDPYMVTIRFTRTIAGTNLNTSDNRRFSLNGYLSTDSILSPDDIYTNVQYLSQDNFASNAVTEFVIPVKPLRSGLNYIIYKIDGANEIAESNENNNVSNALPFNAYALSCASNGIAPWNEWISNVKLNTINNTSEKTRYGVFPVVNGYSNFLDVSTTLNKGQTYPLSITPSLGYPSYPTNLFTRIWIDYNQNGIFEDAEIVLAKNGNSIATQNITVPATALVGTTAMRVSVKAGAYPTACEVFDKGEVEDYTITIQAGTVVNNSCRYQDSLQLVSLYNATGGANWRIKWDLTKPITTWYGVTQDANGCVNGLFATGQNLVGTLPNLNLPKVEQIFLNENRGLTGPLPSLNLPALTEWLEISNDNFSGVIPTIIAPKLVRFIAFGNQFSGTVPSFNAANFPALQSIILTRNKLTGSIPNYTSPVLREIELGSNQLTGLIPSFNLPGLVLLGLEGNKLTGSIPNFTLPIIRNLALDSNQLSGCLPSSLRAFCNVATVSLLNNPSLSNQNFATFCSNNTGACIDNSCRTQDSLQLVSLYNATGGANWTNKWNLATPINTWYGVTLTAEGCVQSLQASNNGLIGTLPNLSFSKISSLSLSGNRISGTIPPLNLPVLTVLSLLGNQFTGVIPNFTLPNLFNLELGNNKLTGTIPNFNFPNLQNLQLASNQLTGSIPNFNFLPNLGFLLLSNNQLTGAIPNFVLPKLTAFIAENNRLTGGIPSFTGTPLMSQFLVTQNDLSGCLPLALKSLCGKNVSLFNNPSLSNTDFGIFCATNTGLCGNVYDLGISYIKPRADSASNFGNLTLKGGIDAFGFDYKLVNNNSLNYAAQLLTNFYLSKDTILDSTDSLFAYFTGPVGVEVTAGNIVPRLPDGDYYLIGKVNPNSVVTESNYNNNTFVVKTPKVRIRNVVANDIVIGMAAVPSVYNQFEGHLFKVTASNLRSTAYTNVKVQFIFPAKTTSGGTATPTTGTWQEYCSGGVRCFTWTIPTLAAGSTATLDVPLYILDATGLIIAKSTLLSSTPTAVSNIGTTTLTPILASPVIQPLVFQVPTQLIPIVIQRISPNPTEGDVQVKLDSWTKQTVDFNFSDITGKTIHSEKRDLDKGLNKVDFDLYHLPQGVYFIQTNAGQGKNVPMKFVKM